MKKILKKIYRRIFRNKLSMNGIVYKKHCMNLEYWKDHTNIGDLLSKTVFDYMIERNNIDINKPVKSFTHFLGIGSIIGLSEFDAIIWGSGVNTIAFANKIYSTRQYVKYDIRAVRGPITQQIFLNSGYNCPNVYGDPAILMPLIYKPNCEKKYKVTAIIHYSEKNIKKVEDINYLDVATSDYEKFIDVIVSSEKIISSSLHGIILAEAYGVPAVYIGTRKDEFLKYYDYYWSTERYSVKVANSIEEAVSMIPMNLPSEETYKKIRENLINSFPTDEWVK